MQRRFLTNVLFFTLSSLHALCSSQVSVSFHKSCSWRAIAVLAPLQLLYLWQSVAMGRRPIGYLELPFFLWKNWSIAKSGYLTRFCALVMAILGQIASVCPATMLDLLWYFRCDWRVKFWCSNISGNKFQQHMLPVMRSDVQDRHACFVLRIVFESLRCYLTLRFLCTWCFLLSLKGFCCMFLPSSNRCSCSAWTHVQLVADRLLVYSTRMIYCGCME